MTVLFTLPHQIALLHALAMVGGDSAPPILHLRTMNPYVAAVLGPSRALPSMASEASRRCWTPRAEAALPQVASWPTLVGVSGFAFQGTNAHVTLVAGGARQRCELSRYTYPRATMQKRVWLEPMFDPLVTCARGFGTGPASRSRYVFSSRLDDAHLAHLWDHAVGGRALFPGTGFFGMAQVAGALMLSDDSLLRSYAITGVSLSSPVVLSPIAASRPSVASQLGSVLCSVGVLAGDVRVAHERGTGGVSRHAPPASVSATLVATSLVRGSTGVALVSPASVRLARLVAASALSPAVTRPAGSDSCPLATGAILAGMQAGWTRVDPAVADNATQLIGVGEGARRSSGSGRPAPSAGGDGAQLRIPAALAACRSEALIADSSSFFSGVVAGTSAASASASCYRIRLLSAHGASALEMSDLELRPVGSASRGPLSSAASEARPTVYETCWLAEGACARAAAPSSSPPLLQSGAFPAVFALAGAEEAGGRSRVEVGARGSSGASVSLASLAVVQASGSHAHGLRAAFAGGHLLRESAGPEAGRGASGFGAAPATSPLWGLMRTLPLEYPGASVSGADVDRLGPGAFKMARFGAGAEEDALRGGVAYVRRPRAMVRERRDAPARAAHWVAVDAAAVSSSAASAASLRRLGAPDDALGRDAGLMLSGGTGGLGQLFAAWGARAQAARPVLLGRSGRLSAGSRLSAWSGAVFRCDLSSREEAVAALGLGSGSVGCLFGRASVCLLHAAGVTEDATAQNQTAGGLKSVFAPKAVGASNMDASAVARPISSSILFSSVSSFLGFAGQANYAMANACLDEAADRGRHSGVLTISVQWGAWGGAGMASAHASTLRSVQRIGMGVVSPAQGLAALASALAVGSCGPSSLTRSVGVAAVSPLELPKLLANAKHLRAVLSEPGVSMSAAPVAPAPSAPKSAGARGPGAGAGGRRAAPRGAAGKAAARGGSAGSAVAARVQATVSSVLHSLLGQDVGLNDPLLSAGLDSLGAVELRNKLGSEFGVELPATLAFDYPTPAALVSYLCDVLPESRGAPSSIASGSGSDWEDSDTATVSGSSSEGEDFSEASGDEDGDAAASVSESESADGAADAYARALSIVEDSLRGVLGRAVGRDEPLMDAGLDSLAAVELRNTLGAAVGAELPATLSFDYPTAGALATFIATQATSAPSVARAERSSRSARPSRAAVEGSVGPRKHADRVRRSRAGESEGRGSRGGRPSKNEEQARLQRREAMLALVASTVGGILGTSSVSDSSQPLMEAGLDSLASVELRNSLMASTGLELPATFVFDYPSIHALTDQLLTLSEGLGGEVGPECVGDSRSSARASSGQRRRRHKQQQHADDATCAETVADAGEASDRVQPAVDPSVYWLRFSEGAGPSVDGPAVHAMAGLFSPGARSSAVTMLQGLCGGSETMSLPASPPAPLSTIGDRALPMHLGNIQIQPRPRGALSNLAVVPAPGSSGAMEVKIMATGLNFRDLLNILGAYPGDPGPPGSDCAGVAVGGELAAGVSGGDAVMGWASGALGTHAVALADHMPVKPSNLTFVEAATVPTVYLTVEMALLQAGGLRSSESVLVHGATGGVGLTAVRVAQACGAHVIGTAGGPGKRSLLRSLHVPMASDSRGLRFADDAATLPGVGADVVLNSLTSSGFVAATLACTSTGARFTEIGKREIHSFGRMSQERADVRYHVVAVDFLTPAVVGKAFRKLTSLLSSGDPIPLPALAYGLGDVAAAFKALKGNHVGKVVVGQDIRSPAIAASSLLIRSGAGCNVPLLVHWAVRNGCRFVSVAGRAAASSLTLFPASQSCMVSFFFRGSVECPGSDEDRFLSESVRDCRLVVDDGQQLPSRLRVPPSAASVARDYARSKLASRASPCGSLVHLAGSAEVMGAREAAPRAYARAVYSLLQEEGRPAAFVGLAGWSKSRGVGLSDHWQRSFVSGGDVMPVGPEIAIAIVGTVLQHAAGMTRALKPRLPAWAWPADGIEFDLGFEPVPRETRLPKTKASRMVSREGRAGAMDRKAPRAPHKTPIATSFADSHAAGPASTYAIYQAASKSADIFDVGENLADSDTITCFSFQRWDVDNMSDPSLFRVRFAGFRSSPHNFDTGLFGVHPSEALVMDPQQRLLLEYAHKAFSGGEFTSSVPKGVFIGGSSGDYSYFVDVANAGGNTYAATGYLSSSVLSGRIAYTFGFQGPTMTVETACSSALVGMHLAWRSLRDSECGSAAVGGCALILTPSVHLKFSAAGMLSSEGRCKALDDAADGYVRAEEVAMLGLCPFDPQQSKALAAVVGTMVNQDGRSSSLTAPNGPAQQTVIRSSLAISNLAADAIAALGMHGTGTALGDPIEMGGIAAVFRTPTRGNRQAAQRSLGPSPLTLTASKSRMGHGEWSAGMVSGPGVYFSGFDCLCASRRGVERTY